MPQQNGRLVMVRTHSFCIFFSLFFAMNVHERTMLFPIRASYALDLFWGLSMLQDRISDLFRPLQANLSLLVV
jgi:hypothetical protein